MNEFSRCYEKSISNRISHDICTHDICIIYKEYDTSITIYYYCTYEIIEITLYSHQSTWSVRLFK